MPERLSLASVAACAVLAVAGFGGAYALAHNKPAEPAPAPAGSPTTIRLERAPIGELHRVSALPALIVPPPRPQPTETVPVVEETPGVVPASAPTPSASPTPTPAPTPTPKPKTPTKKPLTFDDSG